MRGRVLRVGTRTSQAQPSLRATSAYFARSFGIVARIQVLDGPRIASLLPRSSWPPAHPCDENDALDFLSVRAPLRRGARASRGSTRATLRSRTGIRSRSRRSGSIARTRSKHRARSISSARTTSAQAPPAASSSTRSSKSSAFSSAEPSHPCATTSSSTTTRRAPSRSTSTESSRRFGRSTTPAGATARLCDG